MALQALPRPVRSKDDVRIIACFKVGLNVGFLVGVDCTDGIGGGLRRFEGVGNGESDVLAPVTDRVIFERRPPLKADAMETRRGRGTENLANVPTMKTARTPGVFSAAAVSSVSNLPLAIVASTGTA